MPTLHGPGGWFREFTDSKPMVKFADMGARLFDRRTHGLALGSKRFPIGH